MQTTGNAAESGVTTGFSWSTGIVVVIPSYKVSRHILDVIAAVGSEVDRIYVVDDKCPEQSGDFVKKNCTDTRVVLVFNQENLGVGGAVMAGYRRAIEDGAKVIVKIDGDGQMHPGLLPLFVSPILAGQADYTKGNRFYDLRNISKMPRMRIFGNAMLSLLTKLSTGYWDLFDPTNGYTAIHADVAAKLPLEKISKRYFFETDMLFRLGTFRAVVHDIAMDAKYENEVSNLKISRILGEFVGKHARNFLKRIFYTYYLRDVSVASLELPFGLLLFASGLIFGFLHWWASVHSGVVASAGTAVLAALPIILGLQFLLGFLSQDIASTPRRPIHPSLGLMKSHSEVLSAIHGG